MSVKYLTIINNTTTCRGSQMCPQVNGKDIGIPSHLPLHRDQVQSHLILSYPSPKDTYLSKEPPSWPSKIVLNNC